MATKKTAKNKGAGKPATETPATGPFVVRNKLRHHLHKTETGYGFSLSLPPVKFGSEKEAKLVAKTVAAQHGACTVEAL